ALARRRRNGVRRLPRRARVPAGLPDDGPVLVPRSDEAVSVPRSEAVRELLSAGTAGASIEVSLGISFMVEKLFECCMEWSPALRRRRARRKCPARQARR